MHIEEEQEVEMRGITDRQKEVLNYISSYSEENSYPPTVRDISEHFGISLRARFRCGSASCRQGEYERLKKDRKQPQSKRSEKPRKRPALPEMQRKQQPRRNRP